MNSIGVMVMALAMILLPLRASGQDSNVLSRISTVDQVIASLAHELQHAVEVVQAPEVVDVATLRAMFRRIGVVARNTRRVTVYETRAAEEAEQAVRRELRRTQRAVHANR